ncbi:APA family fibronectin-binding glycoprotein [Mycolicibacterium sp. CBMA 234]|uniref:APA family fibronectin-binding glycoprotein n=1 Tax=Mycolicibacterium sp. CBMA 234 TaxID=1918495 RepID=UPI0012DE1FA1|nr:APA family fibronectin-binding glycoprotein [Mycolicibacterium sp. CBMA 234]
MAWRAPSTAMFTAAVALLGVAVLIGAEPAAVDTQTWSVPIALVTTDEPQPADQAPQIPNAGRVYNNTAGFSFVPPPGWIRNNSAKLTYGSDLYTNAAAPNGVILLGPVDLKLFASGYPNNTKAVIRLSSDLSNFLRPYTGTRINGEDRVFQSNGLPAASTYFETTYDDPGKDVGQMWASVVGIGINRYFAVWLGSASSPIDKNIAQALAESIRPY